MTVYNASRKADREAIAAQFIAVAEKFGAKVERRDEPRNPGYSGAGIFLSFALNGAGAMVSIDDLHGGHEALISWFNDYDRERRTVRKFSSRFNVATGDLLKTHPHHKATSSGTWDMLAARLQAGLRHAANGTAFIEESE